MLRSLLALPVILLSLEFSQAQASESLLGYTSMDVNANGQFDDADLAHVFEPSDAKKGLKSLVFLIMDAAFQLSIETNFNQDDVFDEDDAAQSASDIHQLLLGRFMAYDGDLNGDGLYDDMDTHELVRLIVEPAVLDADVGTLAVQFASFDRSMRLLAFQSGTGDFPQNNGDMNLDGLFDYEDAQLMANAYVEAVSHRVKQQEEALGSQLLVFIGRGDVGSILREVSSMMAFVFDEKPNRTD